MSVERHGVKFEAAFSKPSDPCLVITVSLNRDLLGEEKVSAVLAEIAKAVTDALSPAQRQEWLRQLEIESERLGISS